MIIVTTPRWCNYILHASICVLLILLLFHVAEKLVYFTGCNSFTENVE